MNIRPSPTRSVGLIIAILLLNACEAIRPSLSEAPTLVPDSHPLDSPGMLPTMTEAAPLPTTSIIPPEKTESATPVPPDLEGPGMDTGSETFRPINTIEPGQAVIIAHIAMFTPNAGWAIGGLVRSPADHILFSQDGGFTWLDRTPPASLPDEFHPSRAHAFFLDLEHAWVSYSGSSDIWYTKDGGRSWQSSPSGYAYARQDRIFFSDPDHGWLLRSVESGMGHEYVALFRTIDGGTTWEQLIDPYEDEALQGCLKTGLSFTEMEIGWITYDCQGIYPKPFIDRTLDGGETWSTILLPLLDDASIMAIGDYCSTKSPSLFSAEYGALIVQCVSLEGDEKIVIHTLYLTRDGGTSWEQVTFPGEDILFLDDQKIFALGRELYFSSNAARSWRKVKILAWDGQFSFVDDQLGWAVATAEDEIALVFTTDGGTKWTELKPTIALP